MPWDEQFEQWIVDAFWQMLDDLEVHYSVWPDLFEVTREHPEHYGRTEEEQIENYILDALYDIMQNAWWESISPAQGEAFWEEAKNTFFLAALETLEEVIAEPIHQMNEAAYRAVKQSFEPRFPLKTPLGEFMRVYGEEGPDRYEDYSERLHVMAYVWTTLFFAHLEAIYPNAKKAVIFGPHYRRSQLRVITPRNKSKGPSSSQTGDS
ncbi:hypothetical protein [Brockia lithotrophica]|uniref:Uncharacterized protein n=1 Tax=Brockia lithotrophica TaxID=933949 RepID=A0A660KSZ0_9BACL|nr:hypothetical protein [Brockia lithotrophica]RKQ83611.1 hypothetical protein C7438_1641 [Brockia lithotrophica]